MVQYRRILNWTMLVKFVGGYSLAGLIAGRAAAMQSEQVLTVRFQLGLLAYA
jgi:hypothetical protein